MTDMPAADETSTAELVLNKAAVDGYIGALDAALDGIKGLRASAVEDQTRIGAELEARTTGKVIVPS